MQGKTAAGYVAYKAALLAEVPELRVSVHAASADVC
jgi:hypothetical protein